MGVKRVSGSSSNPAVNAPAVEASAAKVAEAPAEPKSEHRSGTVGLGLTLHLPAAKTWTRVFHDNAVRANSGDKPWTDEEIANFLVAEFPKSKCNFESRLKAVRAHRSLYNNGKIAYQTEKPPAELQSVPYDANGSPLPLPTGGRGRKKSESAPEPAPAAT